MILKNRNLLIWFLKNILLIKKMAKAKKPKKKIRNRANFAKRRNLIQKNFEVLKQIKKEI